MKTQLFGIAAIVLAFAGSAFTSAKSVENNAKRIDYYWYYNNPSTHAYELQSSTPTSTPPGGVTCAPVVSTPQICLKGFTTDPGAANAATTTAQQTVQRQLIP
jgi:hypothetical protein